MGHCSLITHTDALRYPENSITIFVKSVEAKLKININNYYNACCKAYCQSYNIDQGEPLVPCEVSDCRNKIVSDHNMSE